MTAQNSSAAISNAVLLEKIQGLVDIVIRIETQQNALTCKFDILEQRITTVEKADLTAAITNSNMATAAHKRIDNLEEIISRHDEEISKLAALTKDLVSANTNQTKILTYVLGMATTIIVAFLIALMTGQIHLVF